LRPALLCGWCRWLATESSEASRASATPHLSGVALDEPTCAIES
jgi:hypothetical protein